MALVSAMSSLTASGSPGIRNGAVSARTAITDMWWATTSWSSRAIRARSSSRVLRACSSCSRRLPSTSSKVSRRRVPVR